MEKNKRRKKGVSGEVAVDLYVGGKAKIRCQVFAVSNLIK